MRRVRYLVILSLKISAFPVLSESNSGRRLAAVSMLMIFVIVIDSTRGRCAT
jgi:hypothetical protein